ncbi:DUF445 family protein [Algiphilus sp. W345]|uniref:DUF445 family protein n=1 Tax=Banduia mediterranea TaxID=3075609 RepID=A0ABU2WE61_9GAMM|nr:DUF445 family protein [Algiphilus sp. W345]MDT0496163.1 DUF445 family protein [Algiphilus sp. W345]
MNLSGLVAELQENLWVYLAIPLVAGMVGYVTKSLAVQMIFRPLEFVGIRPWLGWQGILPRKAEKIAALSADLMASRLLDSNELFERLDPDRMMLELQKPLMRASESLIREIGESYFPGFWTRMPLSWRRRLIERYQSEIPGIVVESWNSASGNVTEYFDIRRVVTENLIRDKAKLNEIFWRVGGPELRFFRNIGFWFGLGIGLVQLGCWITWHEPLLMPLFGGLIGFVSDWVALQLLFRPLYPKKIMGFTVQGKFLARQDEVAREYASLMANELLTPAHMIEELLRGPALDRIVELVHRRVRDAIDERLGWTQPVVVMALGHERYEELRKLVAQRIVDLIPEASKTVEQYALDALDINSTILSRMNKLSPEEFESVLRPAFKENEMLVVIAGAILGAAVGELQVFLMLGGH